VKRNPIEVAREECRVAHAAVLLHEAGSLKLWAASANGFTAWAQYFKETPARCKVNNRWTAAKAVLQKLTKKPGKPE
jgi:alkaline phosphatase